MCVEGLCGISKVKGGVGRNFVCFMSEGEVIG